MNEHFKGNIDTEQIGFELFAQGLLFDDKLDKNGEPRRRPGCKIHMMDDDMRGYLIWHAFARLVALLYGDNNLVSARWLQIDRHIGLAAGILAALIKSGKEPEQINDPTSNKPTDSAVVEDLRRHWLDLDFQQIDSKIVQLYDERYNV